MPDNKKKKKGRLAALLDFFTQPLQPKGQIGNRNAEKQDRPLPGGRDKDIRVRRRRKRG